MNVGISIEKTNPSEVRDGIIDAQSYINAKYKILWILKEVNDEHGGGWDLRKFVADKNVLMGYNRWKATFGPVIEVSYGILNGFPPYAEVWPNTEENIPILRQIAVINVNKLPGKQWCSYKGLIAAFDKFKSRILKQIDEIDPRIIIGGGTLWLFYKSLGAADAEVDKACRSLHSFKNHGRLWLDAYHPGQRTITHELYYNQIIDRVRRYVGNA